MNPISSPIIITVILFILVNVTFFSVFCTVFSPHTCDNFKLTYRNHHCVRDIVKLFRERIFYLCSLSQHIFP